MAKECAAEQKAHEEPVAYGYGQKGPYAGKIHGFGDDHMGNDAEGVDLVDGGGVETGEEVGKEGDVGSACKEADDVADEKEVVCHQVVGFGAYVCQLGDDHHQRGQSQQIATDGGVEPPSHKEGVPIKAAEIVGRGVGGKIDGGAGQAEESEDNNADKVGKNDVVITGRCFHKRVQRYVFFLKQQFSDLRFMICDGGHACLQSAARKLLFTIINIAG